MVKTTVYLPADLKRALERLAHVTGASEAELIRLAIKEKLDAAREVPAAEFPVFDSGDPTFAGRDEELLADTGFGAC